VGAVAGVVQLGDAMPGQALAAVQQGGLVGLDGEHVVRLLAGHEELGGLWVGLERVGGDHYAGKVQGGQQRGKGGRLLGRAADLALGQHRAGGVVHRGQQVHGAAIAVGCWCAGAAQRLAVDGDRPSSPVPLLMVLGVVTVAQPGTDHRGQRLGVEPAQRAADRGLSRDHPPPRRGIAAGAERGTDRLRGVGRPCGDRGERPGTGQHRGSHQAQDGDQRVAAPGAGPWVGDGGQVGEQVRRFGRSERAGIAKRVKTWRGRG
jgi:hypothetical protein